MLFQVNALVDGCVWSDRMSTEQLWQLEEQFETRVAVKDDILLEENDEEMMLASRTTAFLFCKKLGTHLQCVALQKY